MPGEKRAGETGSVSGFAFFAGDAASSSALRFAPAAAAGALGRFFFAFFARVGLAEEAVEARLDDFLVVRREVMEALDARDVVKRDGGDGERELLRHALDVQVRRLLHRRVRRAVRREAQLALADEPAERAAPRAALRAAPREVDGRWRS